MLPLSVLQKGQKLLGKQKFICLHLSLGGPDASGRKTKSLSSAHLPEATICEMYSFLLDQNRAFASYKSYLRPWREIQLSVSPLYWDEHHLL